MRSTELERVALRVEVLPLPAAEGAVGVGMGAAASGDCRGDPPWTEDQFLEVTTALPAMRTTKHQCQASRQPKSAIFRR